MPAGDTKPGKSRGSRRSKSPRGDHRSRPSSNNQGNSGAHTKQPSSRPDFGILSSMVRGFASSAAAKFTSGLGSDNPDDKAQVGSTAPGNFDIYLFAQSWSPRFCCDNAKQCKREGLVGIDDLSPHGIWPAYAGPDKNNRTYPAYCKSVSDKGGRKEHEWWEYTVVHCNVKCNITCSNYRSKHGTCTVLTKDDYFKEEDDLGESETISNLRDLLNNYAGDAVDIADIHSEVGGNNLITLMANKHCQLQEITTCWEKLPSGKIGRQLECPSHLLGSNRNSAILNGCRRLALDISSTSTSTSDSTSASHTSCASISKEYLQILKRTGSQ